MFSENEIYIFISGSDTDNIVIAGSYSIDKDLIN